MTQTLSSKPATLWKQVKVGDALRLINGRAFKPSEWKNSGVPIVRIQNLNNPDAPFNYYEGELPEKFLLDEGDLLFAWSGTPGTSFGAHIWRGGKAWLNQHIFKVQFKETDFDKRYLQLAINQNLAEYIRAAHGAAGLAHITKGRFESSELPIPPLPEQRRIVAEIEKQFTRLDAGVAALKRVRANLKRYRAAVLKAACEGLLVPTEAELAQKEGRPYETGDELLARILAERRKTWAGRGVFKEPESVAATDLSQLPEGWCWATAEQICTTVASGSTPVAPLMSSGAGEVPFIKVYNLTHSGILDFTNKPTFVGKATHEGQLARSRTYPGDVLMNIVGPPLGKVSLVPDQFQEWNINQAIVVFRPTGAISNRLLAIWFLTDQVLAGLVKTAKATAGQFNLQVTSCRKMALPLPPLAEQTRIVAEVERRLSVVEELDAVVALNLQRAGRLRQAVLHQAFSGNL